MQQAYGIFAYKQLSLAMTSVRGNHLQCTCAFYSIKYSFHTRLGSSELATISKFIGLSDIGKTTRLMLELCSRAKEITK